MFLVTGANWLRGKWLSWAITGTSIPRIPTSHHATNRYCVTAASCQGFLLLGYDQYVAICEINARDPSVNQSTNSVYCIGA